MTKPLIVALGLALAGGCASVAGPQAKTPREGPGYLDQGPAVSLDATPPAAASALQLLDERVKENAQLRARVEELETAARAAEARAQGAEKAAAQRNQEVEQIKSLLERSTSENREMTDEVLKSRIARLRVEQEMLRLKLADLVRESK